MTESGRDGTRWIGARMTPGLTKKGGKTVSNDCVSTLCSSISGVESLAARQ